LPTATRNRTAAQAPTPTATSREVRDKAQMWLRHGVRLVWVVCPDTRTVDVHQTDRAATLGEQDTLSGLDVLAGFACPIKAVFEPMGQ